jgi:hypothetical protein
MSGTWRLHRLLRSSIKQRDVLLRLLERSTEAGVLP